MSTSTSFVAGIISFPGSNGDHDALHAFGHDLGVTARAIDYREPDLGQVDAVVLPGGFSYGDALRCGAIARFSPVMESLKQFAEAGGPVVGFCNGFQVLCEAHLLPGALLRNSTLSFQSKRVNLRVEANDTPWTSNLEIGDVLNLPIANGEGSYFLDQAGLAKLEANNQIVFRYSTPDGQVADTANPNGSVANIAGICNLGRNVVGLMPHPERATDPLLGGTDGLRMLKSVLNQVAATR